ncbi:uncharacterized protein LOC144158159 isoform X7 [Haemaphysalis longicornis]
MERSTRKSRAVLRHRNLFRQLQDCMVTIARMPRATSSRSEGCIMAMSPHAAHGQHLSFLSQETQVHSVLSHYSSVQAPKQKRNLQMWTKLKMASRWKALLQELRLMLQSKLVLTPASTAHIQAAQGSSAQSFSCALTSQSSHAVYVMIFFRLEQESENHYSVALRMFAVRAWVGARTW